LLSNPGYLGWPHPRVRGAEYDSLVDEFVAAVGDLFPHALIQWEDFRKDNALRIMDRYRGEVLSFNDDIQGTGAVALAGMLSAQRVHGRPLRDERVLIVGAGAAGLGISRQIKVALAAAGVTGDDLQHSIAALDSKGLIIDSRVRQSYKAEMAWTLERAKALRLDGPGIGLLEVCRAFRPTVLIGTSGQRNAFSEAVVREVASTVERPVILPLSNPTDLSEAVPADVYAWSEGRALVAAGSPFPPVDYAGRTYQVGQGNNAFIFPGIGHGAILSGASSITDSMFYAAAKALARMVSDEELAGGSLYPSVDRLHEVSLEVARAVIRDAAESGMIDPISEPEIERLIVEGTWSPEYREYSSD
jgi:malate dehydrogenase (oxaloacetate-decarboxylating)